MNEYFPEGARIGTAENRAALRSLPLLKEALQKETVLEARAVKCGRAHELHVDLGVAEGIIPREEGALGIDTGAIRDVALISRVGKPVCFVVTGFRRDETGRTQALLSRKRAQEKCVEEYLSALLPGDVINVAVTHMEAFGVFCDVGAGVTALLPVDAVSVSRIPHPGVRFFVGQQIKAAVRGRDTLGRISLTHKELLGTWEENAALFAVGETVPGVIRSVESYGVFVELTPNLAGLAEFTEDVRAGQTAAVYIKSILPERMKIKLVLVDVSDEPAPLREPRYFFAGNHISHFRYSPAAAVKVIETVFY